MQGNKQHFEKASKEAYANFMYANGAENKNAAESASSFLGTVKAHVFTFTGGLAIGLALMYLLKK